MTIPNSPVTIMTAMQTEAQPIIDKLGMKKVNLGEFGINPELPLEVYQTTIMNKKVILTYNGKDPVYNVDRVGIGSAVETATIVIDKLKPSLIISAGTAGGLGNSEIKDVYISDETFTYCDTHISVSDEYEQYGKGNFPHYPISASIIKQLGFKTGRIATSNSFELTARDSQELERSKASAVDMEATAIAGVCKNHKIPMLAVKVLTNHVNDKEAFKDNFKEAVNELANKVSSLVEKLLELNLPANSYYILDETNIRQYLIQTADPFLKKFSDEKTVIKNIGDGNLNHVFRITNPEANESIVLKQALPYAKILGENSSLSSIRMFYEITYLQHVREISPAHIPEIYYIDKEKMMVLCMQDLNTHQVIREGLSNRIPYPAFFEHVSSYLAEVLFKTSQLHLSNQEFLSLSKKFHGNTLCELTKEYVFTLPFKQHPSNHLHHQFSSQFRRNAATLRNIFSTKCEALIHGDLHTGSLMANENTTFIIDSEFAFMGPMSFDVGMLLANLITAWVSHRIQNSDINYRKWLLETIKNFYIKFSEKFSDLWTYDSSKEILSLDDFNEYKTEYLQKLLSEAVGFAGTEICRRICGKAGATEIRNIQDLDQRSAAEQLALAIGQAFVENYSDINSTQAILEKISVIGRFQLPNLYRT